MLKISHKYLAEKFHLNFQKLSLKLLQKFLSKYFQIVYQKIHLKKMFVQFRYRLVWNQYIAKLKRKCRGKWHIISPLSEKAGGRVPSVLHLSAPMEVLLPSQTGICRRAIKETKAGWNKSLVKRNFALDYLEKKWELRISDGLSKKSDLNADIFICKSKSTEAVFISLQVLVDEYDG